MWRTHSSETRTRFAMPRSASPWCANAELKGVPACARVRDLIDVGFGIQMCQSPPETTTKELAHGLWAELSTSVSRIPYKRGAPHVFRQNSYAYSYDRDVVLSGMSQMQLMGWPRAFLARRFTDSDLRHLSGESFSLPICAMLHFCMYCNPYGDWWQA